MIKNDTELMVTLNRIVQFQKQVGGLRSKRLSEANTITQRRT